MPDAVCTRALQYKVTSMPATAARRREMEIPSNEPREMVVATRAAGTAVRTSSEAPICLTDQSFLSEEPARQLRETRYIGNDSARPPHYEINQHSRRPPDRNYHFLSAFQLPISL